MNPTDKRRCLSHRCNWRGSVADVLRGNHPFDSGEVVVGCPQCRQIGTLSSVCDEPGCWDFASCGWPQPDGGYRFTCYAHSAHAKKDNP